MEKQIESRLNTKGLGTDDASYDQVSYTTKASMDKSYFSSTTWKDSIDMMVAIDDLRYSGLRTSQSRESQMYLVIPSASEILPSCTSQIIHRELGGGNAYPYIVRRCRPESPYISASEEDAEETEEWLEERYTLRHDGVVVLMICQMTQTESEVFNEEEAFTDDITHGFTGGATVKCETPSITVFQHDAQMSQQDTHGFPLDTHNFQQDNQGFHLDTSGFQQDTHRFLQDTHRFQIDTNGFQHDSPGHQADTHVLHQNIHGLQQETSRLFTQKVVESSQNKRNLYDNIPEKLGEFEVLLPKTAASLSALDLLRSEPRVPLFAKKLDTHTVIIELNSLPVFLPSNQLDEILSPVRTFETKTKLVELKDSSGLSAVDNCQFCNHEIKRPSEGICCEEYKQFFKALQTKSEVGLCPRPKFGPMFFRALTKTFVGRRRKGENASKNEISDDAVFDSNEAVDDITIDKPFGGTSTMSFRMTDDRISMYSSAGSNGEVAVVEEVESHDSETESERSVISLTPISLQIRRQIYYHKGINFLTLFNDSSGHILYPSRRPAIIIIPRSSNNRTYILMADSVKNSIRAVFSTSGVGYFCDSKARSRLSYNTLGGTQYKTNGSVLRSWTWDQLEPHVHAPPTQPINFQLTKHFHVKFKDRNILLIHFSCETRSFTFNAGANIMNGQPYHSESKQVKHFNNYLQNQKEKIWKLFEDMFTEGV